MLDPPDPLDPLGPLEEDVLALVWDLKTATVRADRAGLLSVREGARSGVVPSR